MIDFRPYIAGAGLALFGLAWVPLSGLLPRTAEPPQPAVLDAYYNLAAQQSITLRSLFTEVPALDEAGMKERAAGHYEMVCADCHGSPLRPPQQFSRNMSPTPPLLVERMAQWHPPARIFATLKHGISRTAMPGWPSQLRDDEVWDMVAFLQTLPDLDANSYASLIRDNATGSCESCHGVEGQGGIPGTPRLDIQTPGYLAAALKAFRNGSRQSGTMMAAARQLSDDEINQLAQHYGRNVDQRGTGTPAEAAEIAQNGIPERDIPACASCHNNPARPSYPKLDGQDPAYLLRQLKLFKEHREERGGPNAHIMAEVVRFLEEDEMKALAEWYGR